MAEVSTYFEELKKNGREGKRIYLKVVKDKEGYPSISIHGDDSRDGIWVRIMTGRSPATERFYSIELIKMLNAYAEGLEERV